MPRAEGPRMQEAARAMAESQPAGNGAQGRDRTTDTAIFSRMLYQLSYLGIRICERPATRPASGWKGAYGASGQGWQEGICARVNPTARPAFVAFQRPSCSSFHSPLAPSSGLAGGPGTE